MEINLEGLWMAGNIGQFCRSHRSIIVMLTRFNTILHMNGRHGCDMKGLGMEMNIETVTVKLTVIKPIHTTVQKFGTTYEIYYIFTNKWEFFDIKLVYFGFNS